MTTTRSASSSASSWSCVTKTVVWPVRSWIRAASGADPCAPARRARRTARRATGRAARPRARGRAPRAGAGRRKAARGSAFRGRPAGRARAVRATRLLDLGLGGPLAALAHRQTEGDVVGHGHVAEQGVVLEHEADIAPAATARETRPRRRTAPCPRSAKSKPAGSRSSVVLPEPDGPSRARNSPERISSDVVQRRESGRIPCDVLNANFHIDGVTFQCRAAGSDLGMRHSSSDLTTSVTRASRASSEATAKAANEIIFVVEDLDLQRHGVRQPRIWPETTETAPNSPMARALQSRTP
jgi:hypothetical protein